MRDRISTIILVTLISIVVWLYAEAESRDTVELPAVIRFVSGVSGYHVAVQSDWNSRATVEFQGSRTALLRAREVLDIAREFSPGDAGVPLAEGEQSINLLAVLQADAALREAGVTVLSSRPLTVLATLEELETIELPVVVDLGEVSAAGDVEVLPATVQLTARRSLIQSLGDNAQIRGLLEPIEVPAAAIGSAVTARADLATPHPLRGSGARIEPRSVEVTFVPEAQLTTATINAPVWVRLPPTEVGRWQVNLADTERFVSVTLTGPPAAVERHSPGGGDPIVAMVSVAGDALRAGSGRAPVWLSTRSGAPIGDEIDTEFDATEVSWTATAKPEAVEAAP
ncbi:MAG: hypothetical protein AAGI30_13035 [Planctomycetota bacterium]